MSEYAQEEPQSQTAVNPVASQGKAKCRNNLSETNSGNYHLRIQSGEHEVRTPPPTWTITSYRTSKQYWSRFPGNSLSYKARIQCWAIIGPPSKRHLSVIISGVTLYKIGKANQILWKHTIRAVKNRSSSIKPTSGGAECPSSGTNATLLDFRSVLPLGPRLGPQTYTFWRTNSYKSLLRYLTSTLWHFSHAISYYLLNVDKCFVLTKTFLSYLKLKK